MMMMEKEIKIKMIKKMIKMIKVIKGMMITKMMKIVKNLILNNQLNGKGIKHKDPKVNFVHLKNKKMLKIFKI
jgi:hypothetical protein